VGKLKIHPGNMNLLMFVMIITQYFAKCVFELVPYLVSGLLWTADSRIYSFSYSGWW